MALSGTTYDVSAITIPAQSTIEQSCLCPTPKLEFHMGIRLHNSSWHRPLRTLDTWPPMAESAPSRWHQGVRRCGRWLSLLWLGLGGCTPAKTGVGQISAHDHGQRLCEGATARRTALKVHVAQKNGPGGNGSGHTRLVISGRMADVCAELDRLAALEAHGLPQGS
mgnify:CR=1 FL=1